MRSNAIDTSATSEVQQPNPARTATTLDVRVPSPRAWVASALVDETLREVASAEHSALCVFSVSVHEAYPPNPTVRLGLLQQALRSAAPSVPRHTESLWVFPAGYFGYDAVANNWRGCDMREVETALLPVMHSLPSSSICAVGVDASAADQEAWVYRRPADG